MKITVLHPKLQLEPFYQAAIQEYDKRLSRYCKLSRIQLKNEAQMTKKLQNSPYLIVISTSGNLISSEALAEQLNQLGVDGHSDIQFVLGNYPEAHAYAEQVLALSPMCMDIGLTITLLYEQLYRAYRIMHQHPYHK